MLYTLITKWEGCRLTAYKCSAGIDTIGYGNTTYPDGSKVKPGDVITQTYAEALLKDYVERNICPLFTKIPYKLTTGQQAAIASLVYNVGASAFLNSKLYTAICERDLKEICRQWDWFTAGGKVLKGLVKRRVEELYFFVRDL